MDYMVFFKDWGGQLLSGFGIIGGIWAYLRHDRKIKCQEKVLNELQIRQLTKTEEEGKKAEIKCNFIPNKNGGHIRFVNAGKSDARNVHVEIITPKDELEGLIIDKWEDYELINPQSYREELVGLCIGSPDYIKLKVIWEDDYSKDRTAILSVQL